MNYLQVDASQILSPKTLASLGFICLAAYAFGDIAFQFKLPKISGYLIAGILFGPYSKYIFGTDIFGIFTVEVVNDIKLINGLAVGLIALTAGGELRIPELKNLLKGMTYVIVFKFLLISSAVFVLVLVLAPYIPIFAGQEYGSVIAIAIFLSILMLGTSPAATIAVINETQSKGRLTNFVLGSAVLKDILMVILLALGITIAKLYVTPGTIFEWDIIFSNILDLIFSLGLGFLFGYLFVLYLRYVKTEHVLFVISAILIITEISNALHLDTLLIFIAIGFFVQNFSKYGHDLIDPIEKLSVPIFVIFFTIAGAGLNIEALFSSYQIALIIFVLRIVLLFVASKIGTTLSNEPPEVKKNVWMGFISQSAVVLGLSIIIIQKIPEVTETFSPIILAIVGLNLLVGPMTFKFALRRAKETPEEKVEKEQILPPTVRKVITEVESIPSRKIIPPSFENQTLNNVVDELRLRLINIFSEIQNNFINKRSEGSIEFFYEITEKYIDEYQKLKTAFTKPKATGREIKTEILTIQHDIAKWFAELSISRKIVEREILTAENILHRLFDDLKEFCDHAFEFITVDQEEDKFIIKDSDSLYVKVGKRIKRIDRSIRKAFAIKSTIKRKIPFVKLIKYYFDWQIPLEMEKIAFLVGMERLHVLQQVKKVYDDVTNNFEELLNLIAEHKDIEAIATIAYDKLNDIHAGLKSEIKVLSDEINQSNQNINIRLEYAFANPYNNFLNSLDKAGTVELSSRKFNFSKIYRKSLEAKENTLDTIRFWVNYFLGYLGVCERDAKIYHLAGKVNSVIDETMIKFSDTINDNLRSITIELLKEFKKILSELSNPELIKVANSQKVKEHVNRYKNELLLLLHEKGVTKLTNIYKSKKFNTIISVLLENFANISESCDKTIKVLDEKDFEIWESTPMGKETKTKYVELKTLPFRAIVKSFLEKDVSREVSKINEIISSHLTSSINELKNIGNIVNYHFSAAVDEIDREIKTEAEFKKVLQDTIFESANLIKDKIKVWDRQIDNFEREIEVGLTEKIYKSIEKLKEIVTQESTKYAAAYLEREVRVSKIKSYAFAFYDLFIDKFLEIKTTISQKYNQVLKPIFEEVKESAEGGEDFEEKSTIVHCYNQTTIDPKTIDSLPFIYRRLFDASSSEVTEFIIGRNDEKGLLKQAYQRVSDGLPGSAVIIGEVGTGKSTLINYYLKDQAESDLIYKHSFSNTIIDEKELLDILLKVFRLDYAHSFRELSDELLLPSQVRTVVLEDIHKLFLRKYGGFEAIRKLLLLISETNHKVFWVTTISSHAWKLLNNLLTISNYFPYQIKTENLSEIELKEAILSRHQTSGFEIEYVPSETTRLKRQFRHAFGVEEKKKVLEEEFFSNLSSACEGNFTSALFYWLRSMREVKGNLIRMNPFMKIDLTFLQIYPTIKLLTLANLIQHGSLKVGEHQQIFNLSYDESLAILNFLAATNLVQFEINQYGEKIYSINKAIYKPLEKELRRIGIFE